MYRNLGRLVCAKIIQSSQRCVNRYIFDHPRRYGTNNIEKQGIITSVSHRGKLIIPCHLRQTKSRRKYGFMCVCVRTLRNTIQRERQYHRCCHCPRAAIQFQLSHVAVQLSHYGF